MNRPLALLALVVLATPAFPAQPAPVSAADLAPLLNFEGDQPGPMPAGWRGGPTATLFVDDTVFHSGKHAARIERTSASENLFSTLTASLPLDFTGKRIELRGFFRMENVTDFAGFWLREDGDTPNLGFDSMQRQNLKGTIDWHEYSISLPVHPDARTLVFGFMMGGTGKAWADDLQLLVDGKPIWEAPKITREQTALDRDHEFDEGSKIALHDLTPVQIENLATLGRVWGFLKYHHPKITSGQLHWDYELFRVMPAVLAAADRAAANEILAQWIDRLGALKPGPDPKLPSDLHLRPDLAWLDDRAALGERLSTQLRAVHAARLAGEKQFYLSRVPNVSNPAFDHELGYAQQKFPDAGYQLLALFRFWNIIRYWSPYRDLIDDNWDAVLAEFIPRLGQAGSAGDYQRELIALIARVHDTHANLWSALGMRPPPGDFLLPAVIRFVEGQATVIRVIATAGAPPPALQRGDAIRAIGGTPVDELVRSWRAFFAASNEPTRLRDIGRTMGRGPAGPVSVRVQRGQETVDVEVTRIPAEGATTPDDFRHDLPGDTFRLLSKDVAYLKLSSVKAANAVSYVQQAASTKGWIIDARDYPSEFMVFTLGSHFVEKPTEFARFTFPDPANPGAFAFGQPLALRPHTPHYAGKLVILVDEVTQSSAEYTTMAFRSAPGAIVIGSTTAAADGNVSRIPLPGGQHTMISGIGVFYPDKHPTQRIGIIPDIEAHPTLAGIRAGRDEVLEVALRKILGSPPSDDEIRRLMPSRE